MRKNIVCMFMALVMVLSMGTVLAEQAVSSVTIAELVKPADTTYDEGFTVFVTTLKPETTQMVVFEELAESAKDGQSAEEYFGEEVMKAASAVVAEGVELANLQLDEFFPIEVAGYQAEYGAVEATFQFATEYAEGTVLVAMVGIVAADGTVTWIPLRAEVVEGKVQIAFTEEALEKMAENNTVLALLRAA